MTRTRQRATRALGVAGLAAVLAGTLVAPGPDQVAASAALARIDLDAVRTLGDPVEGLADLDTRGSADPTPAQRSALDRLGAVTARWNDLGTPSSLLPEGDSLGAAPGAPAAGARAWLAQHAAVFGLSPTQVAGLELVQVQQLAQSSAAAVLFRQVHGGLPSATGGLVTVGVSDQRVRYVSSSLVRAQGSPAAFELSPLEGWLAAASNVGRAVEASEVGDIVSRAPSRTGGWTRLTVPGLAQEQLVRPRSLALADGTVRPVLEANVVDAAAGRATAYTVLVDGVTGTVLVRRNQVDNLEHTEAFTGTITGTECGDRHAFELTDDLTRTISAVAVGAPSDDFVVKLFGPDGLLVSGDLATNPEVATYSAPSIPGGTYSAQVCPYDPASALVGRYTLAVNTTDSAAPEPADPVSPRWRWFPANPTLDSATETPTNSRIACWRNTGPECDLPSGELANIAAVGPWDAFGALATMTTTGNNASTREAWASPLTPGGLFQAPVSPTRAYTAEFTDAWNNSGCDPAQLRPGGNDIDASVGNLFVSHNRMHDYAYYLGFTEENYNLQVDNQGRGGVAGDPEVGNAQAGAVGGLQSGLGRDNANQITLQDGTPGITNQYLFQPIAGAFYAPCTDGGLDMGIVGHEYTHAISNRMVGGPDDGLTSEQGGAMGESWSDLVAGEYQFSHGYDNGGNIWAIGAYATGNLDTAIRDYAIDRNPLNYSDYGFDSTGPEVHADGEIWNGTLWEVRQALVDKYDARFPYADAALQLACAQATRADSPLRPELCPGNRRWVQLVFDSFLLQQGATSMLDARDAMLAADRMRFGGANQAEMWKAFARRGMGRDASTPDADSDEPTPSFASPIGANSDVTFTSASPTTIYVGEYEARVTPVADTSGDTVLPATAAFTPGSYRMLAVSPDRGFTRFTLEVGSDGGARTVAVPDSGLNLAAAAAGASVLDATPGSLNAASLIDGTEATNWGGVTERNVDETTPYVAVDLAGDAVQTVGRVQVSSMLTPAPADPSALPLAADPDSGSRFTALRQFAVEACTSDCSAPGATWTRFYTSPADAFPSRAPRPVAPDLTMRSFDVPDTPAAAVRLVTLHNQCTGGPDFAGEQDSDPTNATDCKTESDRGTIVHASELQVFAAGSTPGTTTPGSGNGNGTGNGNDNGSNDNVTGTGTGTTAAQRRETSLQVTVRRAVQRAGARPPRVTVRVLSGAEVLRDGGRVVVRLDGARAASLDLRSASTTAVLRRGLKPGVHRVRVVFRPDDGTSYLASRSVTKRIRVLRR